MNTRERCESAIRYRKSGANCAQSLLAAFADVMGITEARRRWPWARGWAVVCAAATSAAR